MPQPKYDDEYWDALGAAFAGAGFSREDTQAAINDINEPPAQKLPRRDMGALLHDNLVNIYQVHPNDAKLITEDLLTDQENRTSPDPFTKSAQSAKDYEVAMGRQVAALEEAERALGRQVSGEEKVASTYNKIGKKLPVWPGADQAAAFAVSQRRKQQLESAANDLIPRLSQATEQASAVSMLEEYVRSKDQARANEATKRSLWQLLSPTTYQK